MKQSFWFKKILALALSLSLTMGLMVPVFAQELPEGAQEDSSVSLAEEDLGEVQAGGLEDLQPETEQPGQENGLEADEEMAETAATQVKYTEKLDENDEFYVITQPKGSKYENVKLSVSKKNFESNDNKKILKVSETVDGVEYVYAFKDLNGNSELDVYEDWRKDNETRVQNLLSLMSTEDCYPLMMYSWHFRALVEEDGDILKGSKTLVADTSTREVLQRGVRALLNAAGSSPSETQIKWSNAAQAFAEEDAARFGIPVSISSDPRSNAGAQDGDYDGSTSTVSKWPGNMGMGATFNAQHVKNHGMAASAEYRALGITTALSPQIDLATEPRWVRIKDTFGEDADAVAEMTAAYVHGFQSTFDENGNDLGWGKDSVAVMLKHWPGDGIGEAGRESHHNSGKFGVHPGNNLDYHVKPFAAAIDKTANNKYRNDSGTYLASSIMPSYSISVDRDGYPLGGEMVGSGYSKFKMHILRNKYKFDGIVCTDWGIAGSYTGPDFKGEGGFEEVSSGTGWGVSGLPYNERIWKGIAAGIDMYGGMIHPALIKEACRYAKEDAGVKQAVIDKRIKESAYSILVEKFRLGLFDDAFVDTENSMKVINSKEKYNNGYNAQRESIVMLKNQRNTIAKAGTAKKKVYIPLNAVKVGDTIKFELCLNEKAAKGAFDVVTDEVKDNKIVRRTDMAGVDFALVKIKSPANFGSTHAGTGWDVEARNVPGDEFTNGLLGLVLKDYRPGEPLDNGFIPRTLQYREYTADTKTVRAETIALDPDEEARWQKAWQDKGEKAPGDSRYYGGKSAKVSNEDHLDLVLGIAETAKKFNVPVVTLIDVATPMVFSEFESKVDSILLTFSTSDAASIDVISGKVEPKGKLPVQMPANMATVEKQFEDVAKDMDCHVDTAGNKYDYGFGLGWTAPESIVKVESVTVSPSSLAMKAGEAKQLSAAVLPEKAADKTVSWQSGNSAVATVDSSGKVTAVAAGEAVITATANDGSGKSGTASVKVSPADKPLEKPADKTVVTSIKFSQPAVSIIAKKSITIPAKAYTNDGKTVKITYSSSKPKIASVNGKGKITAKAAGTAYITAKAGTKTAKLKVTVVKQGTKYTAVKKVTANVPKTMKPGQKKAIVAKYTPSTATAVKVTFKSSNTKAVKVDKYGTITAVKKGKAVITVKAGKVSKAYKVTVK